MRGLLAGLVFGGAAMISPAIGFADSTAPSDSSTPPATRPSRFGGGGGMDGEGAGGLFGGGEGRQRPGPPGHRFDVASPEEITAAIEFYTENSPNRMAYFNKLPADGPMRRGASQHLAQAYRPILNFKDTQPELYKLLVKQVQLRDEAFKLAKDGKDAELLAKATEIVNVSLQARGLRLDLLKKQLAEQQSQLAEDNADKEAVAEKEVTTVRDEVDRLMHRMRNQQRGQTMLDFDPCADPLADAAPIFSDSTDDGL